MQTNRHCQLPPPRTGRLTGRFAGAWPALCLTLQFALAVPVGASGSPIQPLQKLNTASVNAFAGREIPPAMREGKIPGAVFVVVQDGRVICEKAFGVADLKTRQPVSTETTLFRVASISKILTAASALQLVQAGRLDLHRDVNDYLARFQIAPAFDQPVTLFNLLTHSGGFDQNESGYAARSAADKLSLRDYLERHQPARVRPPGRFSVYDNYGFALAGYLVQNVSGMAFADYVRKKILDPLDMDRTSFAPDAALRKRLATGYWLDGETPQACGQNYVNIAPAAGLCTTASDMSEFLVALLANRRPDGSKMFSRSVLDGLETEQFAAEPEVPGRCFGFNQILLAGRTALRQPAQWPGFNSVLLLFPEQHSGLFLAYNLCDYEQLEKRISRSFAEQFIAPDLPPVAMPETPDPPAGNSRELLTGIYLSARSAHEAPTLNWPREIQVTRAADGKLEIDGQPYHEMEPLVFAKTETNPAAAMWSGRRVAFQLEDDGKTARLITQSSVYRRAAWYESREGHEILLWTATLIFLSAAIIWPAMLLLRRLVAKSPPLPMLSLRRRLTSLSTAARATALVTCALALWFELSLGLAEMRLKPFADFYGFPSAVRNLLWALPVLLALTIALVGFSIAAWRQRLWHPAHRLHYTLIALAGGLFLYVFYTRNLIFAG